MQQSISDLFTSTARRSPKKTALIFEGASFTYEELDAASSKIARALRQFGINKGDRVSLYGENCPQWIIAYYGILKAGAVVNPLNLMLTADEVIYALRDCNARAIVGSALKIDGLVGQIESTRVEHRISWGGGAAVGAVSFEECLSRVAEPGSGEYSVPICSDDPSTVAYTSGTTGHPKGAQLSHRSVVLNVEMTALMHGRTSDDVMVMSLPFSHVYGNVAMQSIWARGGTAVLHRSFDAIATLRSIDRYKATLLEGVPTMYMYMLDCPELTTFSLSSLTRCTVGGQTMPVSKMRLVEAAFGCPLIELWGMTEIGGLGATHTFNGPRKLGSIGIALPHTQLRIADPERPEKELDREKVGELQVRGAITMTEYLHSPSATQETLIKDGWLRTGDLARMDSDGFVYVVDRLKDMILTAGFNVYPAEIERVLADHPDVAMAAVGAVPDEAKGELARAYIVARQGTHLDLAEVEAHCRSRLAAYKVPRKFVVVNDLPKTSSGKIMRRALKGLDPEFQSRLNEAGQSSNREG